MEETKIRDFINEITIPFDGNYVQKILKRYLEYKGLIDPKNAFDVFKFDTKLASPINEEDYKKFMDVLNADYTANGTPEKSLEECLQAVPNKVSLSSYALLNNTSLENSNYDHRTFKFSIAVSGANLYAVLNILYDLAKRQEYRFNFELPPLNLQKSGLTDKIVIYSEISNLKNTLDFLNEASPLIESLVAPAPSYKGTYKEIYSVDSVMNKDEYYLDPKISKETYIKDTKMHLLLNREKSWTEEVIGEIILKAIDECIVYIANHEKNITINGTLLLEYFNEANHKLIARRKIIKDIKDRCLCDIGQMLVNTVQNRLQSKGINLSNAFLSVEAQKLLSFYIGENTTESTEVLKTDQNEIGENTNESTEVLKTDQSEVEEKKYENVEIKTPVVEIDQKATEANPIAEGLPSIAYLKTGHSKYFVNEEIAINNSKQDDIDWKKLEVNMEDYGNEELPQEEVLNERQIEVNEKIDESQIEAKQDDIVQEEVTVSHLLDIGIKVSEENKQEETEPQLEVIEPEKEETRTSHVIGEYRFIDGYPDKLEETIFDKDTGQQISLYDYFEKVNLLDYFPTNFVVNSSIGNIQNMKTTDFINRYLVPELQLKGTVNLENYIKACKLKIEKNKIVEKEVNEVKEVPKVRKSSSIEDYSFIKGYPQKMHSTVVDNRASNMALKMSLYSYFQSEHLLELFPKGYLVSGDNFKDLTTEEFINEQLLPAIGLYGAIDLKEYMEKHNIQVKEQTHERPNESYLMSLNEKHEDYYNKKYAYFLKGNPQILKEQILDIDGEPISLVSYFEREKLLDFFPQGAVLSNVNYDGPITSEIFINTVLIPYVMINGAVNFQDFIETQQWTVEMITEKKKGRFGGFGRFFK